MFWNMNNNGFQDKIEYLTHADAFLTGMEICDSLAGSVMQGDHSYFEKLGILFPLIAFERKMTYIFRNSHQSRSMEKSVSPEHQIKYYDFKRPKITITMEDLENLADDDESTDDDFDSIQEKDDTSFDISPRVQLKRQCQVQKNLDSGSHDKENLQNTNFNLEKNLSCPKCPFKCETSKELEKHDKFYHQKWPIAAERQDSTPLSLDLNHR